MNPTILIAGATGATGRVATELLLKRGLPVRAMVHQQDERSAKLADLGAEIVVGDLLDFSDVRRAFNGAARAYFVYPLRPGIVQATAHFAQAALEAGADFIVNMSQRTTHPDAASNAAVEHWIAERVFDWAGTPVAHLRPTMFHDWLLYMHDQIRDGRYEVPFGTVGKFAPVASEDQAAVIAAILADPGPHAGKIYPLTGPEELTAPEIATVAAKALGHDVHYRQISGQQWAFNLHAKDIPFLNQHLDGITKIQEAGGMSGLSDVVERIGGQRPMSMLEYIDKHRAAFA